MMELPDLFPFCYYLSCCNYFLTGFVLKMTEKTLYIYWKDELIVRR